jgi:UDP-N-acetyl-alpha-D-quinovosamine dehydrogenase
MSQAEGASRRHRRVFVSGATGFIGGATAAALSSAGYAVLRGARDSPGVVMGNEAWTGYGEIGPKTDWDVALEEVDTIVHAAGLAHLEDRADAAERLWQVNVGGTASLAAAAVARRIRRFILISSVAVNGSFTRGRPFTEDSGELADNSYGRAKLEAERRLKEIARGTDMECVIVRPPLVYGFGARGNFRRLVNLVRSGLPLPLGCATAPRSFIALDNLTSVIRRCVEHPSAANETFLVRDAEQVSTVHLIHSIAAALGRRVWTPRIPASAVRAVCKLVGREGDFQRLFEPLDVDSRKVHKLLDWSPPVSMVEGLRRAVATTLP